MNTLQHDFLDNLFREKSQAMFSYALRSLNDPLCAEDVVMLAFSVAVKNVDKLMNSPNPQGWLMKTLKHKIAHEKLSLSRRPVTVPIESLDNFPINDTPEPLPALSCLTSDEDKLVELIYGEKRSIAEAASELHISESACKKRLQRLRDKIKKNYKN